MSSPPLHPDSAHPPSGAPEPDRVRVRAVYAFVAILALALVIIVPAMSVMYRAYRGQRPLGDLSPRAVDPGDARHWTDPQGDLAATRHREDRNLHHYDWMDRDRGVVRIPITRAMDLLVERSASHERSPR